MSIKYHDNTIPGWGYGPDGQLLDNWDPSIDYGDACAKIYFRVDCPAYHYQNGFSTAEERETFYRETGAVLSAFSVPEGTGHHSERLPGMEHLHLHPQEISGVVLKNKVKAIAEALDACAYCSIRWVDVYEDISPISNEDFRKALDAIREEINGDLLAAFVTRRKNLYAAPGGICAQIAAKYSIRRRVCESGPDFVAEDYVRGCLRELCEAGQIVSAETRAGTCYRTAKKPA